MARTWPALAASIRSLLENTRDDAQGFTGSTREGHEVFVAKADGPAIDWVIVRTPICLEHEMEPTLVLERNGRLAFAVMVLMDGRYWLRLAVPFDSTELNNPGQLVVLLVDAALSLSPARLAPRSAVTDIFDHYAS